MPYWNADGAAPLPTLAKMAAQNSSGQNFPTGTSVFATITNWTPQFDTASELVAATGLYTAPADGYYLVTGAILTNGVPQGSDVFLSVFVGASEKIRAACTTPASGGTSPNGAISVGGVVQASKNDVLRLAITNFTGSTIVLFSGGIGNYWSIAQQL